MSAQLHFLRIVGSIWSLSLGFSADQAEALGLRWWLDSLWTQTGAVLRDESMMKNLQITLRRLLKETLAFVFPSSMRTHIHNKKIHLVLATLLTLHGLIQLRLDSHQPWARKVLHCCVDWLRIAILDTNLDQCALTSLLAFLRQSLEGGALPDEAAVYVLFNGSTMLEKHCFFAPACLQGSQQELWNICRLFFEKATNAFAVSELFSCAKGLWQAWALSSQSGDAMTGLRLPRCLQSARCDRMAMLANASLRKGLGKSGKGHRRVFVEREMLRSGLLASVLRGS